MWTTKRRLSVYFVVFLLISLLALILLVYAGIRTLQTCYPVCPTSFVLCTLEILPLVVAFVFWGISLGVWSFHHRHQTTRLFFLTGQVMAALLGVNTMPASVLVSTRWSVILFWLLFITIAPLTLHFFTLFPHQLPPTLRRYFLVPAYSIALFLLLMLGLTYWNFPAYIRLFGELSRVYVAVTFVVALFVAFRRWKGATSQALRYRRLFTMGLILGFTPALFLSFIPDIVLGVRLVQYPWTLLFLGAVPLTYAFALWKGKLGRVDWVLSRTLAHLVLSGMFLLIYLVLFWWLNNRFSFMRGTSPVMVAGLAVVAAAFFAPVRHALLHLADRFLYGGWYDYRATLQDLSQRLKGVIYLDDLVDLLVDRLHRVLRLQGALFLLNDGDHLVPVRAAGTFDVQSFPPLPTDGPLAVFLAHAGRPIRSLQIRQALRQAALTSDERAWIDRPDVALWLPLIRGKRLEGLLLLGRREGGDPLEPEDVRLLDIIVAHAATAMENIRLVESLRSRVEEVKQLYAQLAQAREEERKHLARELHDGVLQDVINAHVTLDQVLSAPGDDAEERLQGAREQTLRSIQALRRLCSALRPPALDITDLRSAIEGLVDDVRRESGLAISLSFPEGGYHALDGLPDAVSITLYRVLQEALTNVRRHAQARHVHVRVSKGSEWIGLEVEDDGRGFVVPTRLGMFVRDKHYGLAGLEERVHAIGGRMEVQSSPGRGTRVWVLLPLPKD